MEKNIVNMKQIKVSNRSAILKVIFGSKKISQKDIASKLNLTPGAVSIICNDMLNESILKISHEDTEQGTVGRKQVLLEINNNFKYLVGVDISKRYISITLTNLDGDILDQLVKDLNKNDSIDDLLLDISREITMLFWKNNLQQDNIIAVGFTITGAVNDNTGVSLKYYNSRNENINIKEVLETQLNLKVFVENNVCGYAMGEALFSRNKYYDNSLFLKWGLGVGSTVIINGTINKNRDYLTPEIGHIILDTEGEKCTCGNTGCLETIVSFNRISKELYSLNELYKPILLTKTLAHYNNKITTKNITEILLLEDTKVQEYYKSLINVLVISTYNCCKILCSEKVVLYGYMFESKKILEDFIKTYKLINSKNTKVKFKKSRYIEKENYIGAISLAITKGFLDVGGLTN